MSFASNIQHGVEEAVELCRIGFHDLGVVIGHRFAEVQTEHATDRIGRERYAMFAGGGR